MAVSEWLSYLAGLALVIGVGIAVAFLLGLIVTGLMELDDWKGGR